MAGFRPALNVSDKCSSWGCRLQTTDDAEKDSRKDRDYQIGGDGLQVFIQTFLDSYEYYHADWTDGLFDTFQKQHGYDLKDHLPELFGTLENIVL